MSIVGCRPKIIQAYLRFYHFYSVNFTIFTENQCHRHLLYQPKPCKAWFLLEHIRQTTNVDLSFSIFFSIFYSCSFIFLNIFYLAITFSTKNHQKLTPHKLSDTNFLPTSEFYKQDQLLYLIFKILHQNTQRTCKIKKKQQNFE